ncbi:chemotaxis sensory transducer [Rhodospirillum rubrum F11]|uniref:Chemotaxis sensory transducer n=1 Tax=Rhodospirillum rubrum (strain ATCC 11170 / ATH 1.1.1 / DSM 467 / LMG 4362 / NCIMB 8255 / S1) TaxID=269796 RepID=Q2RVJ1_RHORT|nr:chemotaxis sensory transducer [Rhodospirillum rubrum ATCC 11170]AEO47555.1 chemotaxis sensory transducer [Rhodospirillum rubrum F11]MBK5953417.1 chemotaxis protein [Rhodospirillum rubrum]QXG81514.1 PAS domain-containing protein [Rhodospirillum rubrum]HAQ01302.1 chemotaxis protein [Rhodospirillum rubrum]
MPLALGEDPILSPPSNVAFRSNGFGGLWGLLPRALGGGESFREALDQLPVPVILARPDMVISWMNRATRRSLERIAHLLPVAPEDVVGQSIDVFHRHPAHQRALMAKPGALPHHAVIALGDEFLDLQIEALGERAAPKAYVLTWSIVTERVKAERLVSQRNHMLDQLPVNVMLADPKTMLITYANRTSLDTLAKLQHLMSFSVSDLVGRSIDIFHKNPSHQHAILSDPKRLPFHSKIRLGPETLDLRVTAIFGERGEYEAMLLCWSVSTHLVKLADDFESHIKGFADMIGSASTQLHSTAESMSGAAEEASSQAAGVSAAAEELSASVQELGCRLKASQTLLEQARAAAQTSTSEVIQLRDAAQQIDSVIDVIGEIAGQTNLLALNATIEAARAGEHGRGFAVVAGEVKDLSAQTAKATGSITGEIRNIQTSTDATVGTIDTIVTLVEEITGVFSAMQDSIAIQSEATREVARNITGVSEASSITSSAACDTMGAASELSRTAEALRGQVDNFLATVRKL